MATIDPAALDACVHCGLCLAACPTYVALGNEADSPRGRIQLVRGLVDGTLSPTGEVRRHLDLCLGCRACETACPSGVPYGRIVEGARGIVERARPLPARAMRRLLARTLASPVACGVVFAAARPFAGRRALARVPLLRWAAALPRRRGPRPATVVEPAGTVRGTAIVLSGCVADALFRATNRATVRLLAHAGVRVLAPRDLGCCGALAAHLGVADEAARHVGRVVRMVEECGADWIVANAAGCGAHLRDVGPLAARTRDVLALLAELGLPSPSRPLHRRVAVHDPCHLAHGQHVRAEVRTLLASIPGVTLVGLTESDWCCGSAGTYNLTEPAMAARLLERKLDHVADSGAEVVAAANPGCLLQLRAGALARGLDVAIEHPVDLLAGAHGLA